jgi:vacuolar-type H+-ATPase subunit F/Vma7
MEIAVVGSPEFTLGFQLAGVSDLYNPEGEEALHSILRLHHATNTARSSA